MKLFLIIISVITSMVGQSQVLKDSPQRGAQILKDSLSLNDQQAKSLIDLNVRFYSEMTLINNSNETALAKGEKRKNLLNWHDEEMKKVLTLSQYQKYKRIVNSNHVVSEARRKSTKKN